MRKNFIIIFIAALALMVGCKDKQTTDTKKVASSAERNSLHENHLLGAIKSVSDTKYMVMPLEDGQDSLVCIATNHETYNQAGWLSGSYMTTAAGDTIFVTRITFDDKGHVTRSEQTDAKGEVKQYYVYQYDKNGFRTQELFYKGDTLVRKQVCENDAAGNVERITVTEGKEQYYLNHTNNPNGLPVLIEWFSPQGGNEAYMQSTIEYDEHGNVINRNMTLNKRNVEYYHAQYNTKGHLLKELYQRSLPQQLEEISTEYSKHDKNGNWTHQESTRNGHRYYVIERKIEYYH